MKSTKLYSNKQKWKIALSIVALLIIGLSLWYTNYITQKIQKDERLRVEIWSETVQKQAQLVNLTNQTFEQLKTEERKKIELWSGAIKELGKEQTDYTFLSSIAASNKLPSITETIDRNKYVSKVYSSHNLALKKTDFSSDSLYQDSLKKLAAKWDKTNPPIRINSIFNQTSIIHYGNSKLFGELKAKSDSLIKSFNSELVENSALLPVVFIDSATRNIIASNVEANIINDSTKRAQTITAMRAENGKIDVSLGNGVKGEIYYFESQTLKQLRYYPWVQLGIIILFLVIAYFLFSTFRKAEQNQVWAGMAKETAHQLGTPLSSLMAWIELLRLQGVDESSLSEMDKDIVRLNTVTDRFSKIGSQVKNTPQNVSDLVEKSREYLSKRVSKKVELIQNGETHAIALVNESLFEWVIENLTKNAVDAIQGEEGSIIYTISTEHDNIYIDIADTGKGIPANKHKSIFSPGYTTKERGWGLGLSLVKRMVEDQLNGKIIVKSSELNVGTTFRITLKQHHD